MVLAGKARSVLELLLTMEDKSSKVLKKVDSNLGKVNKAAKKSAQGIKGINTQTLAMGVAMGGAVAGALALAKGLYDLGGRGAAVQQTESSYEGLLKKLDVAPGLIEKQRAAVRGTVDDMTLMSATQTLLAGTTDEVGKELAEATPRLLEIAKAANKLNPTLGDTAFLYESIATGIKRGSPLILDNLGLTIKLGEANERYAESLGVTVEELSSEQKTLALLNQVTEQSGDLLIKQAGGVDAVTDAYARNQVILKNLNDELAKKSAPAIGRVIERINELLPPLLDWLEVMPEATKALDANIISLEDYENVIGMAVHGAEGMALAQDWLQLQIDKYNERLEAANAVTDGWTGRLEDLRQPLQDVAIDAEAVAKVLEENLNAEIAALSDLISGRLGPELEQFTEKNVNLQTEAEGLRETISGLKGEEYLTEEQEQELATLEGKLGEVNSAIKENVLEHEKAQKAIVFSLLQQQAAADGYTEEEVAGLLQVAEHWGIIDEETRIATENISGALAQLTEDGNLENFQQAMDDTLYNVGQDTDAMEVEIQELKTELELLEGDYHVRIKISQEGSIPAGLSGDIKQQAKHGFAPGQHGLDMVVPQGFREPDNPFLIGASSGEEVHVTPRGQQSGIGSGLTVNINNPQINSDIDIDNMARQVAEVIREKGK